MDSTRRAIAVVSGISGAIAVAALLVAASHGAATPAKPAPATAGNDITLSFKLDPRLSGPTYGGERWVSPPTFTAASGQEVVEVQADRADAMGRRSKAAFKWTAADPTMVSVTPSAGARVRVSIRRPGESRVRVATQDAWRELIVRANGAGGGLRVELVQVPAQPPAAVATGPKAAPEPARAAPPIMSRKELARRNDDRGETFRAANAKKPGVVTLPSGLQYEVVKQGEGPRPTDDATVGFHYRGTLVDGTEFANTRKARRAGVVKLAKATRGMREAFELMPVGSRWRVVVPPQLAYGRAGLRNGRKGDVIGPGETLVLDLELLAIKPDASGGSRTTTAANTASAAAEE